MVDNRRKIHATLHVKWGRLLARMLLPVCTSLGQPASCLFWPSPLLEYGNVTYDDTAPKYRNRAYMDDGKRNSNDYVGLPDYSRNLVEL